MGFQQRRNIAAIGEQTFETYLNHHQYSFRRTGIETLLPSDVLRHLDDLTPWVRFLPDYNVILNGQEVWVELKTSTYVEREAFESYLERDERQPVFLCLWVKGELFIVRVRDVVFRTPNTNYPDPMPTDGFWKQPRLWHRYQEWRKNNPNASGSDYAEIDLTNTPLKPLTVPIADDPPN